MNRTPQWAVTKIQNVQINQLKELDLSGSGEMEKLVDIPDEVFKLKWLEKLNLGSNKLTTVPKGIDQLKQLTWLELENNQINVISNSITQLENLNNLNLSINQITKIPKTISYLKKLIKLNLSFNQISSIPEEIFQLNLIELYLVGNQITEIPTIASSVTLEKLDISKNNILDFPILDFFENLKELYLSNNQIVTIPTRISRIKRLLKLNLNKNYIEIIPESISLLKNLTYLQISSNKIAVVPESIFELQNLQELDLKLNRIKEIPSLVTETPNLTHLLLNNNPIEKPPLEVVDKGITAIRDYFRQLKEEGIDYLYEAKLLILGEGGAGKTTLCNKLKNLDYQLQEEDSTQGIEIIKWSFIMDNGKIFRVNIWDFGGQEIYHTTHQFFLTKRSLYTLVADTRKEDTDFYYWLNIVELLSDKSPLLIIKNEKQDRHREINERQLRGLFDCLKQTLETNLATNRGLVRVVEEIKHYIRNLPHVGTALPKTWVRVREVLENDLRNYISLKEYLNICQEYGFTQYKHKLQLSGYLHDIGVILHFQDEPILNNTVILKPKWGTDAVYKVMDNPTVIRNLGRFTWNDLSNIWQENQYANKQGELLQLMMRFNLCYEIPNKPYHYIAPQLLSENQPEYEWNEKNNIILRYTYEFMPKGIITQFIVAMHELIYQQRYVWKSGVILSKDNTKAEIIEYFGKREIKIRVTGRHKRDILTVLNHEMDKIHASYKRLKYSRLIPCNCAVCENSHDPYFYKFDELRERIIHRKETVECGKPPYNKTNVFGLIDDVMDRRQWFETEELKEGNFSPSSVVNIDKVERLVFTPKDERTMSNVNQYGFGDNIAGDKVMGDKISTQINNSQNLAQAAKDIKDLLDQLSQNYPNNPAIVGAKAIEAIDNDPTLKERVVNALKEAGSTALEKLVDHPAVSIVVAGAKGFMNG